MEIELPFKAEYARTGRAGCKGCRTNIEQNSLRIAVMVQSAFADKKQPSWYHESCFFEKQRPSSEGDISNFENLRFEDQKRLKKKIAEVKTVVVAGSAKGGKRSKTASNAVKDFGIEYAKSARALCRGCEQKIIKDVVRIKKIVFDSEVGMKYGGQPLWHHVECFAQVRYDLGWLESGKYLPGFESLKPEDQKIVNDALPAIKSADVPDAKKPKLELKSEKENAETVALEKKIQEQNKRLFKFRDNIKESMSKPIMQQILEDNNQDPSSDFQKLMDQLADMLTFGAIQPCPICKGGQMLFEKSGYLCNGELTEWTKCLNLIKEPKRKPCQISSEFKKSYSFLKDVKKKVEVRAINYIPPSAKTISKNIAVKEDETDGPKVKRERPALYNFTFSYVGINDLEDVKKRIMNLGGKLISKMSDATIAVFSTKHEVERMGNRMQQAKDLGLHIIPVEYIDHVISKPQAAIQYINSLTLCDWGTDPQLRLPQDEKHEKKSMYEKSVPKKVTLKVKDGLAVDPDSGLEDSAHVFVDKNKDKYNVVLGLTDIQLNKNSYYKLQLLESDKKQKYYVFRSWGRIGTTIGSKKLEEFSTLNEAKQNFCEVYNEKTGNDFSMREHFRKVPGRMYPIDIDYSEDIKIDTNDNNVKSKLETELQNLMKLMFDIENMKRTMLEFHLDMEKMPLGKLSSKQMQSAYKVLTEIYELIQKSSSNASFIDATNRFYTLIPHNFGIQKPPLLDTTEQVEKLRQMLDSLMEIECAYNMIKIDSDKTDVNPVDRHYEQLKTKMEVLPKNGDEFKLLEQYVQNTHAETHNQYELKVIDIFKVARQGEARRYKPFKKLHNRKLLWHGSRLTNFAGILSHGLKIAPPEAPVTGYMFGKGIYFADMVSKSANYCCTSKQNNTGLLLLSEVALGDMLECTNAKYITQLPKDKHSCFGKGRTHPDPSESKIREDNVEIPMGKPITNDKLKTSLLYNEYIVYDIAQVNIQYLFRVNFNYKY